MSYDEMGLDTLGDKKTALFIIISDTDTTFNFVAALMYSQLFNLLCDRADSEYGGELPVHVRFLLDEFANIGQIPNFDKLVATIRSRKISACVVLQTQSQLKMMYKDAAETIIGNMDARLFLGGSEKTTLKDLSESLGKETIDLMNHSESKGNSPSFSSSYQKHGKELMTVDELSVMGGSKCILQLRGVRPFLSDKYDITRHPRYKYLSDFDRKNVFDVGSYVNAQLKVNPDEQYEFFESVAADAEMPEPVLGDFEFSDEAGDFGGSEDYSEDLEPI
jgi:type IV secretion system protein VirD4